MVSILLYHCFFSFKIPTFSRFFLEDVPISTYWIFCRQPKLAAHLLRRRYWKIAETLEGKTSPNLLIWPCSPMIYINFDTVYAFIYLKSSSISQTECYLTISDTMLVSHKQASAQDCYTVGPIIRKLTIQTQLWPWHWANNLFETNYSCSSSFPSLSPSSSLSLLARPPHQGRQTWFKLLTKNSVYHLPAAVLHPEGFLGGSWTKNWQTIKRTKIS